VEMLNIENIGIIPLDLIIFILSFVQALLFLREDVMTISLVVSANATVNLHSTIFLYFCN